MANYEEVSSREEAQKLLDLIQQHFHLNIVEVHGGSRTPYASTEDGDIEVEIGDPRQSERV